MDMPKVKIKCGTCNKSTYKRQDGREVTSYASYSNAVLATGQQKVSECWDCGTARREAEEAKKQERLKRMMGDEEDLT